MERLREQVQLLNPLISNLNSIIEYARAKNRSPKQVSFLDQHNHKTVGYEELMEKARFVLGKYGDIEDSIDRVIDALRNEIRDKEDERWW